MRACLCLIVFFFIGIRCFAQYKELDTAAIHNWPFIEGGGLSPDGRYAFYNLFIDNPYSGIHRTLVVKDIHSDWLVKVPEAGIVGFDQSPSTRLALRLPSDTIALLTLGTGQVEYLFNVRQSWYVKDFLLYQFKSNDSLYIRDMKTSRVMKYPRVESIFTTYTRDALIIQQRIKEKTHQLSSINLEKNTAFAFYTGDSVEQVVKGDGRKEIAFLAGEDQEKQIFYYQIGEKTAKPILSDHSAKLDSGYRINGLVRFTSNGKYLLFNVKKAPDAVKPAIDSGVNVYSYRDLDLSFEQGYNTKRPDSRTFGRALNLKGGQQTELEDDGDRMSVDNGDYVVVDHRKEGYEWQFFQSESLTQHLVRLVDGKKVEIPSSIECWFSPKENWLLYFDRNIGAYFSMNLENPGAKNLLAAENGENFIYSQEEAKPIKIPFGLAAWANAGKSALIYARDGLWQLDMEGKVPPILLTRPDSGEKEHTYMIFNPPANLKNGDSLTLVGFNPYNKENGFYRCIVGRGASSFVLSKGPWAIWIPEYSIDPPTKAEDASVVLVSRMTADSSANCFVTTDLNEFRKITDVHPERDYNWPSAELFHWTSLDGHPLAGLLYKPKNFDPQKKYPVLFWYYEHLSNKLHAFLHPHMAIGAIDIPYMVSRGYLVFTPDIDIQVGYPGRSAYNAIVSAAQMVGRLPYVDSLHMGIQGHSWAGFLTYYVVTHTGMFAAACAGSGVSDMVMEYGSIRSNRPLQDGTEEGQGRMGLPMAEAKDLYLENSPILDADKITTPLLIFHNWEDDAVDVRQGIAMFGTLRRLGKPAWLLQYPHEAHGLYIEANRVDYTGRMLDFFDHYLKGKPAPAWLR